MKRTIPALMSQLRKNLPTNFPVRVKWVDHCDDKSAATCQLVERRRKRPFFVIELSRARLLPILALEDGFGWIAETCWHEYAHALSWTPVHRNLKDHGPLFGVAYSMCYIVGEKFL